MVKNLLAVEETQVWSLGREDPLEEEMALQYLCLGNSMDRGAWQSMGSQGVAHNCAQHIGGGASLKKVSKRMYNRSGRQEWCSRYREYHSWRHKCVKILSMCRDQQQPIWIGYVGNGRKKVISLGWGQAVKRFVSHLKYEFYWITHKNCTPKGPPGPGR